MPFTAEYGFTPAGHSTATLPMELPNVTGVEVDTVVTRPGKPASLKYTASNGFTRLPLPRNMNAATFSLAFRVPALASALFNLWNVGGSNARAYFMATAAGGLTIGIYDGPTHTATTNGHIAANAWNQIEVTYDLFNTTQWDALSTFQVRINGVLLSWSTGSTPGTTLSTTHATVYGTEYAALQINGGNGTPAYYDDFVIGTGSFPGDIRTYPLALTAGSHNDGTPSAGSVFDCVDDATPDSDTSFVTLTTAGQKVSVTLGAPPVSGEIFGVIPLAVMATDAGSRTAKAFSKKSGVSASGSNVGVSTGYAHRLTATIFTSNPATAEQWTTAEVTGSEIGIEINA